MFADVTEVHKLGHDLEHGSAAVEGKVERIVVKSAYDVLGTAQALVAVDTGLLKSDLSLDIDGLEAEIGPGVDYGEFVELGTSRMAAQPYLGPAFDRHVDKFETAIHHAGERIFVMPDPVISRRQLTELTLARARALVPSATVYDAEVPDHPPLMQLATGASDPSGRVAPYVVVYPWAGRPTGEADLADCYVDLVYGIQLTCAAGFRADLDHLVDTIHGGFFRWAPVITGVHVGGFRPPEGFDPGPHRRDDTVSPPRFWTPLQYQLTATT